jgi:predicted dehydrogenase
LEKLKAGIIGLQHLHPISYIPHILNNNMDLVGVAEENADLIENKKPNFPPNVRYYTNYRSLLNNEKLNIVFIFSQLNLVPEIVEVAAKNKVNVIIEKPMASSIVGAEKIIESCKQNNILASVPYVWRYHSVAKEIKKILDKGVLGEVQAVEGRCIAGKIERYISANSAWIIESEKSGGGAMWNLGVHWIDLFRWFLNFPEAERVYAEYTKFTKNIDIEENSHGIIKFFNGVVCTLNIGYSSPPSFPHGRDLHINIRGTLGSLTWNPAYEGEEDEVFICSDHPEFSGAPNQTIKMKQKSIDGYSGMMGYEYIKDIVNCIENRSTPPISLEDSIEVLRITDAFNRSAKNHEVVYLKN